jgi:multimeric flavodoxin WrbA
VERIKSADIVIFATPITGGMCTSMAHIVLQNLNHLDDYDADTKRFMFYNKVAGMLLTGNEDGAQQVAGNVLFNLSRLGFAIPPNCESYWLGPAGTGPGYIEAHGEKHFHTNKLLRYMVKNLTHLARTLQANPFDINMDECIAAARAESSDVFAIKVDVHNPSLRYRRFQRLGEVPLATDGAVAQAAKTV